MFLGPLSPHFPFHSIFSPDSCPLPLPSFLSAPLSPLLKSFNSTPPFPLDFLPLSPSIPRAFPKLIFPSIQTKNVLFLPKGLLLLPKIPPFHPNPASPNAFNSFRNLGRPPPPTGHFLHRHSCLRRRCLRPIPVHFDRGHSPWAECVDAFRLRPQLLAAGRLHFGDVRLAGKAAHSAHSRHLHFHPGLLLPFNDAQPVDGRMVAKPPAHSGPGWPNHFQRLHCLPIRLHHGHFPANSLLSAFELNSPVDCAKTQYSSISLHLCLLVLPPVHGRWPLLLLFSLQMTLALAQSGHNVLLLILAEHKYVESKMAIQVNLAFTLCWVLSLAIALFGHIHHGGTSPALLLPHFCLSFLLIPYHFFLFFLLFTSSTAKFLPILNSLLSVAVLMATFPFESRRIRECQRNGRKNEF